MQYFWHLRLLLFLERILYLFFLCPVNFCECRFFVVLWSVRACYCYVWVLVLGMFRFLFMVWAYFRPCMAETLSNGKKLIVAYTGCGTPVGWIGDWPCPCCHWCWQYRHILVYTPIQSNHRNHSFLWYSTRTGNWFHHPNLAHDGPELEQFEYALRINSNTVWIYFSTLQSISSLYFALANVKLTFAYQQLEATFWCCLLSPLSKTGDEKYLIVNVDVDYRNL